MWEMRKRKEMKTFLFSECHVEFYSKILNLDEEENGK